MKKKQTGRSMIEMLGVLVIIAVLSIAALFGFTYAMNKHRANETIHDVMLRASNVPMIDEYYQTRATGYAFKFPDLSNEQSTMGYTLNTVKTTEFDYVYKVEAPAIPRRVCNMILRLEPTDIDEIRIGENKVAYKRGAWNLCDAYADSASDTTEMTFYFEKKCETDMDCNSCQECYQGYCNANYERPGCGIDCPEAPACGECEIKIYDENGCHISCQETSCCPAPECGPDDVFNEDDCTCVSQKCPDLSCGPCETPNYETCKCDSVFCGPCEENYVEVGTDECGCSICQSKDCPDVGPNPGCSELIEDTVSLPGELCYTWGPTQLTTKQTGSCCDEGSMDCCPLTEDCSCTPEAGCVECLCPEPGESPCEGAVLVEYDYSCSDGRVKKCQKWDYEGCSCTDNNDCGSCSQCVNGVCGPDETTTAKTGECCDVTIGCCPWKGECSTECVPLSCDDVVDAVPSGEEACYEQVAPGTELCGEVCSAGYKKKECTPCDGESRQIGLDECGCPICEPCAEEEFSCGSECCVAANQFCCGESCCSVGHACCDGVCCGEDQTCGNNGTCCSPAAPCGECEVEATDANGCPICEPDPNCCACPEPGESPCVDAVLEDYDYSCESGEILPCQRWNVDECSCTTDEDCGACYECIGEACVYQEGGLVCGEACCDTSTHSCCGETCCPLGQECCGETCCGVGKTCNNGSCEPKENPCPTNTAPVRPGAANAYDVGEKTDQGTAIWCCYENYASVHKCRGNLSDCLHTFTWRGITWFEEVKCCRDTTDYGEAFSFDNIVLGYQATEPECCYSSDHPDVIGWSNHEYCCPDRGYPYYTGNGNISCHPVKAEIKIVVGYPEDTFEWFD